jgi:hypothetical protein
VSLPRADRLRRRLGWWGERRPLTPSLLRHLAALGVYVLIAIVLYSRAWTHMGSSVVGYMDAQQFTWFFAWDWYAISHGLSPFFSDRIAFPHGASIIWNTSVLLWGVALGPVTALAGPAVSAVLAGMLGMSLAGYTTFVLIRDWTGTWIGPLFGGLLFELCPFVFVQAQDSHLQLLLGAVWVPLLALLASRLARNRGSAVRTGALLGLCLTGELLTGEELLAICAIVFAAALLLAMALYPRLISLRARHFITGSAVAVAVFVVLGAVPLAAQLLGPQRLNGRDIQGDYGGAAFYSLDVANLVIPTKAQFFLPGFWASMWRHFTGTLAEDTGYLGIPLLLVLIVALVVLRRQRTTWWLALTGVVALVLALGANVHVMGRSLEQVPLPMKVLEKAPMLLNLMPVRFTVLVYLTVAVLVARLIDVLWERTLNQGLFRASAVVVAVVSLLTLLPAGRLTTSDVWAQPYLMKQVPVDAVVAIFPYPGPDYPETMYWSAVSGVRYRFMGGSITVPDPERPAHTLFNPRSTSQAFWYALVQAAGTGRRLDDPEIQAERDELHADGIQLVVLATDDRLLNVHDQKVWALARQELTRVTGASPREQDGALVWTVG